MTSTPNSEAVDVLAAPTDKAQMSADDVLAVIELAACELDREGCCEPNENGDSLRAAVATLIAERDALIEDNRALRRAFSKLRNRCCMSCAEHGSCNPDGLRGCAYDDADEDYDQGWNDCLDEAIARTPTSTTKENDQ